MRIQTVIFSCIAVCLVFILCFVLSAHRRGLRIELTRNAEANHKARESRAQETLRRLAANPELKVVREGPHKQPVVLCVISRNIVSALLKSVDPSIPINRTLVGQLENVDVEPVPYNNAELPKLISEIAVAREKNLTPNLASDFNQLITTLQKEIGSGTQILFE